MPALVSVGTIRTAWLPPQNPLQEPIDPVFLSSRHHSPLGTGRFTPIVPPLRGGLVAIDTYPYRIANDPVRPANWIMSGTSRIPVSLAESFNKVKKRRPANLSALVNLDLYVHTRPGGGAQPAVVDCYRPLREITRRARRGGGTTPRDMPWL